MDNQEINLEEYFSEVISIWREFWDSASTIKQEIMKNKNVYPIFAPPCQVYIAHIRFPLDIILVNVFHDKNEPDQTIQKFIYSENDIPNMSSVFLGEDRSQLPKIMEFASEIYKANLEKGQEYKGGGGGSSMMPSGVYSEINHSPQYQIVSPKEYVWRLFRDYMPRTADQLGKIEERLSLQNKILEILYEFQKEDFLCYYPVSNLCSQLGISEQDLSEVLFDLRRKGYILMNDMSETRLSSPGMEQVEKEWPENYRIQLKILQLLYDQNLIDSHSTISREKLLEELSIPENLLFMNIIFLKNLGQVNVIPYRGGVIFVSAQITTEGILRWEEYAQQPIDSENSVVTPVMDDVIPTDLVENLPKEVQIDILKAQTCFEFSKQSPHPIYEASAMYLRKALATAIDIRFKRDGKDKKLYDKNIQPFQLKKIIALAKQEQYLNSYLSTALIRIKWMGDVGVHDYKIQLKETDILSIFQLMRLTLEHLFYNN